MIDQYKDTSKIVNENKYVCVESRDVLLVIGVWEMKVECWIRKCNQL